MEAIPNLMHYRALVAAVAVAGLWPAACTVGPEIPEDFEPGYTEHVIELGSGMLLQRVIVNPTHPFPGDTIDVHSVLRNLGSSSVPYVATICGVHLQGSLTYDDPFARCAGHSTAGDLTPGDSLTDARRVVVTAPAGEWVLEVRHLLEPPVWVAVPVQVRAR